MIKDEIILNYIEKNPYCRIADLCAIYDGKKNDLVFQLNSLVSNGDVIKEDETYILPGALGLIKGVVVSIKTHYAFIDIDGDNDIIVEDKNLGNALLGDTVYVHLVDNINFKVVRVILRSHDSLVGELETIKNEQFVLVRGVCTNTISFKLDKKVDLEDFSIVFCKINRYEEDVIYLDFIKKLGDKNAPGMDITRILLENDCPVEFSPEVEARMQEVPQEISSEEIKNRLDLRDELIITIDGDDSKDLDDAVSIKEVSDGYEVGVHIADVTHYVTPNDPIDKEAYNRGTSIYVVDRVVPMLPFALSNGICSLNQGEDRLTMSCLIKLDKDANIISSKIVPSLINSKARLTYNYVNDVLDNHSENNEIESLLQLLFKVSKKIRKLKKKRGTLELSSEEIKILVDEKGRPNGIKKVRQRDAEKLIEDYMVLANEVVAKTISDKDLPFIYRIHEDPTSRRIDSLVEFLNKLGYRPRFSANNISPILVEDFLKTVQGTPNEIIISQLVLRSLAKARYSIHNKGHFGLASVNYTHFTSPIRRYPDLMVHRLLKMYLVDHKSPSDTLAKQLSEVAEDTSKKERRAIIVEREVNDVKGAEYMEQFIGKKFNGYISTIIPSGIFITLDNGLSGRVSFMSMNDYYSVDEIGLRCYGKRSGKRYTIGDRVEVIIDNVNIEKGDINLRFEETRPAKRFTNNHIRKRRR